MKSSIEELSRRSWSNVDVEILKARYSGPSVSIQKIADELNRTYCAVALKASELKLTSFHGENSEDHKKASSDAQKKRFENPDERKKVSERFREFHATHEHPRGFKGHKRTPEERKKIGDAARNAWSDPNHKFNSPEYRQELSDRNCKIAASRPSENTFSRCKRGYRDDLPGIFFRSSWEANYARFLNFMIEHENVIEKWEYEPLTFWFEEIKRGCRSYKPDFRVTFMDGAVEYHEVKGWMTPQSKTALKRMAKYHPTVTVLLIDQKRYKQIASKMKSIIKGWE